MMLSLLLQVLAILLKLGTGNRFLSQLSSWLKGQLQALQFLQFVFLGGTLIRNPLLPIKSNTNFWAALEKTHWVIEDRMLSGHCFQCSSPARRNTKSQASGKERWPRKNNGITQHWPSKGSPMRFLLSASRGAIGIGASGHFYQTWLKC